MWADGVHFNIRLEEDRQCILVLMGATADGQKELIAIADGYRESEQSWNDLAVGREAAWPEDRSQAGHRRRRLGLLEGLAAGLSHDPRAALLGPQDGQRPGQAAQAIAARGQGATPSNLDGRHAAAAQQAFDLFVETYEAKYPKAVECLQKDRDVLLAFYDFPAEHWIHLRTTNPIESTFATVRLRHARPKATALARRA